jgi:hypothetical protein
LLIKNGTAPDGDVKSATEGAKRSIGEFGLAVLAVGIVRHDHKEIVVTVGSGLVAGVRAKKPYGLRVVGLCKPRDRNLEWRCIEIVHWNFDRRTGFAGFYRMGDFLDRINRFIYLKNY